MLYYLFFFFCQCVFRYFSVALARFCNKGDGNIAFPDFIIDLIDARSSRYGKNKTQQNTAFLEKVFLVFHI